MKRALVLQHAPFEGPARIGAMLLERGYDLEIIRLDLGQPVPDRLAQGELLVVMGGPMGVGDIGDAAYPFLGREVQLLRRCIAQDAPVLGVCLGAQLLAFAAGAAVYPMVDGEGTRIYEVGWAPLCFDVGQSGRDPCLAGLPEEGAVLHWHGDTFDLPAGARHLAASARCQNQAFRLRSKLFGLQFHPEVEARHVERFLQEDAPFVERANGPTGVEQILRDTAIQALPAMKLGTQLLGNLLDAMVGPAQNPGISGGLAQ